MKLINKIIKLIILLQSKIWLHGLLHNIAANVELKNLIIDLNFESVLDIGSNKGQFILLLEKIYKNKIIHSFEPIIENLDKQKQFFKKKKNIYYYNYAIGENFEEKEFNITNRSDSSSFLKVNKDNNKDYKIIEKRIICTKPLDQIFTKLNLSTPILAKIDVQGYELNVLKGCEKSLKHIKYLVIELSDQELYKNQPLTIHITKYLNDRNFFIVRENIPDKINSMNVFQKDVLFENQSLV